MTRRADTRPRAAMVASAIALMEQRGVAATSFADVVAHSGAPRGSIYHHFPGGKSQLVQEATRSACDDITGTLRRLLAGGETVTALRGLVERWRCALGDRDYAFGCPIVAAALGTDDGARELAGEAFSTWAALLADALTTEGLSAQRAHTVSVLVVGALEGALIMAQARRSTAPLDGVVAELETLIRTG